MFPCSYLPVVFLLVAVFKGMATDPIAHNSTSDGGTSTTPATSHMSRIENSSSSINHSSTTEHSTASVATTTIDNATVGSTTTKSSFTQPETTSFQPTPESSTTTATVNSPVTENSNLTTRSPDVSPSAATSGTAMSTAIQETSRPTNTMSGNTTASSGTTPTSTTTTSTGTTITGTTQRPTGVTTNNSSTTPTSTTISTGTNTTIITQRPTDVTTNNSSTTPMATTISTGTTITGTTQQPTGVTTTNSSTTPTSTTISTGTNTTSITQRPTDVTPNNSSTTPMATTTISTGTNTTSITQRPTDVTINNSSTTPTSATTISTGTTVTRTTQRPTDTTAVPPVSPVIVCPTVPCPIESVCLNGTCQCLSGSFLVNGRCAAAQVFPGQLHLTSLTFQKNMSNRASEIFQTTAAQISKALRDALKNQPGYKQSDVVQLEPGSVRATVNNIFENTTATQESVAQAITEAITNPANDLFANATFTGTNLCTQQPLPCDVSTTMCTNAKGQAVCSCKEGYISILYSNTSCRMCPSGQRAERDVCQPCAFGYAGFNCNDSALLAVVIVSCVLGALLIIVLALLAYCYWSGCARSKTDYSSSPYSSGDLNQPWPTGVTPIPRATTNREAASPIEMSEGSGTRTPVEKTHQTNGSTGSYDLSPEGMNTFKGKNPSRYSYLVQGHENPYFLPGDGKDN
ncbi:mucin-13 [Clinocottus analis]|uniref:mucin-13 n=1 Tax=Clinocottus analis TaxID=304258 RepID=UPI0035C15CF8